MLIDNYYTTRSFVYARFTFLCLLKYFLLETISSCVFVCLKRTKFQCATSIEQQYYIL